MLEEIIGWILKPQFSGWLLVVKIILSVISLGLAGAIIFFLIRTDWLKFFLLQDLSEFLTYRPYGVRRMIKAWKKISKRIETGLEAEFKLAIIEADSLLDETLRRMDFPGKDLKERLENLTEATLPNLEDLKQAHQIRTRILREPDFTIGTEETKRILEIYERALRQLHAF